MAVELHREARARGLRSVFVPTGQTGIMIEGWGIAVDAVVADFLAGAAERLVVEGAKRGDLLWVEGQGAILHPQFSGVTLGLYHGAAPHVARARATGAGDVEIEGVPGHPIPPLPELDRALRARRAARPPGAGRRGRAEHGPPLDEEARAAVAATPAETGLAADDPVRFGRARTRLLDVVLKRVAVGYNGRVTDPRVERLGEPHRRLLARP